MARVDSLDGFLAEALAEYHAWRALDLADRIDVLRRMADELRAGPSEPSQTISRRAS